jgi:hypothetical protein
MPSGLSEWVEVKFSATSISTPPSASTISLKPVKSTIITWSTRTPVKPSTACTISGTPPHANAALIFASVAARRPSCDAGTRTRVSRGIETICAPDRSAVRCSRMIVSLREPDASAGSRESLQPTPPVRSHVAGRRVGRRVYRRVYRRVGGRRSGRVGGRFRRRFVDGHPGPHTHGGDRTE